MSTPRKSAPRPPAWAPERVISASEALGVISGRFPEFADARAELLAEGWDNTAIQIATEAFDAVFRFPRRQIAVPGVHRELQWLPRLAPLLPLPIPSPAWAGTWTQPRPGSDAGAQPWPYWGARLLLGGELLLGAVPDGDRDEIAAQLGVFLRTLHSADPAAVTSTEPTGESALALDPLGRGHPQRRFAHTTEALAQLAERGLEVPVDAAQQLLEHAATLPPPADPGVLCHGDLHARHVLVDAGGGVSGIIDWGDLCRGDPAIDLSIAYAAFRGRARGILLDAYGPVSAERELRARALALFLCARLTEYALDPAIAAGPALLPDAVTSLWRAIEA